MSDNKEINIRVCAEFVAKRGLCDLLSVKVDPDAGAIEINMDGVTMDMSVERAIALLVTLGQAVHSCGREIKL